MEFVELIYSNGSDFIPTDGRFWGNFCARVNGDGEICLVARYNVYRYARNGKQCSCAVSEERTSSTIISREGETMVYFGKNSWDYYYGATVDNVFVDARVVESDFAIGRMKEDKNTDAVAYLILMGDRDGACRLYEEMGEGESESVSFSPLAAAVILESGVICDADPDEAYRFYLRARSFSDLERFFGMGYGAEVLRDPDVSFDGIWEKREYAVYRLLKDVGDDSFSPEGIAGEWLEVGKEYSDPEMEHDIPDEKFWRDYHKYTALFRREAAYALLSKDGAAENRDKIAVWLGAYYGWLETGDHDRIFYREWYNSGDEYDSCWESRDAFDVEKAMEYIRRHSDDELAEEYLRLL